MKYFNWPALLASILLPLTIFSCKPSPKSEEPLAQIVLHPVEGAGLSAVAIPLDAFAFNTDHGRFALFDADMPGEEIPSQLETGHTTKLWFVYDQSLGTKKLVMRFIDDTRESLAKATIQSGEAFSTVILNEKPVLNYHHAAVYPPEGVDPIYHRSAFIHPLWSPGGAVLTRIQPPDHIHHYGIWNPWTMTTIEGLGQVDFWNLIKGEGRVRFGGYLAMEEGPVYANIRVRHEHIAYTGQPELPELLAINEEWDIRVWDTGLENVSIVDLTTTLSTPLSEGILMNAYRYGGGIGYRATDKWTSSNSRVLTSEGKTREETDASNARWCIIEGETEVNASRSGIIFLSHPSNRMHPEPMRMWNSQAVEGRGEIFYQFTPIRNQDWKLETNKSYSLKYRMIVYDGEMSAEEADQYWNAFSKAPVMNFL